MTIQLFLSYLSTLVGLSASMFFIIGTITLTPKKIAEIASTYLNYNEATAKAFLSLRLDYTCGAILLVLSFAIQMLSLFQANQAQPVFFQTLIHAISFLLFYTLLSIAAVLFFRKLFGVYLNKQLDQELPKP